MLVCLSAFGQAKPKAPGTDLVRSVSAEQPVFNTTTRHGDHILLARYSKPGASAIRLRIENMRLPEGAVLFAYSLDAAGAVRGVSGPHKVAGDVHTTTLPGDTAFIEVQWGNIVAGDLPFDRVGIVEATDSTTQSEVSGSVSEVRSGNFQGRDVTYEIRDGLAVFEQDIVLGTPESLASSTGKTVSRNAVAITGNSFRWPGGVVPYVISSALPLQSRVTEAVAHWNDMLDGAVKLVPRTNQSNYVLFVRGSGCSSYVGMVGIGAQQVWLADSCSTGSAIHEIGHAIGLWHEQARADRNSHIRVLWENVSSGAEMNFSQSISTGDDIGAYDHGSIMHYGTHTYTRNGRPTIETIPEGIPIGQRVRLSSGDIAGVRRLYGGTATTPSTVSVTFNTNPAGLQVRVDGAVYTTPKSFSWTPGSAHTIEAIDPAAEDGVRYNFARWSDNGGRSHTISASSALTSYTATYALNYQVAVSASPSSGGRVTVEPDSGSQFYAANASVDLTATPSPGFCFSGWSDLISGTPAITRLSVTRAYWPRANFTSGAVTLSPETSSIPADGGTGRISVSANSGCRWEAESSADWITITSGRTGTGPASLSYSVAANTTGASRTASILIDGQTHRVTQSSETAEAVRVTGFVLINADTNQPIAGFNPIANGATINLAALSTRNLNVRAVTNPETVGSVDFFLNGTVVRTESGDPPYALAADTNGNYLAWTPPLGVFTIGAQPYTSSGAKGTALTIQVRIVNNAVAEDPARYTLSVQNGSGSGSYTPGTTVTLSASAAPAGQVFDRWTGASVANVYSATTTLTMPASNASVTALFKAEPVTASSSVAQLVLINAVTNQPIGTLVDGMALRLSSLPTTKLNVQAITSTGVGSVRFTVTPGADRVESVAPYALAGDTSGNYWQWTPPTGVLTITATPYSGENASGTPGSSLTVRVAVLP